MGSATEILELPRALVDRLDAAFSGRWLISHPQAAALLETSEKTLKSIGDEKRINYRLRGRKWRVYAREDIEAYVGTPQCQSSDQSAQTAPTARSPGTTTSSSARRLGSVVAFTAQRARERARKRSVSKTSTAS